MNKVILLGNLGGAVELKYTPSGAAVATVSIATTEHYKDKQSGERKQQTEWHRVVFWNRLAEIMSQFTSKGSQVLVTGKIRNRSWDDNGVKRYMTEVVAQELRLLGAKGDGGGAASGATEPVDGVVARDNFDDMDDDIPF